jgi:WXG100 family type VII secretion target
MDESVRVRFETLCMTNFSVDSEQIAAANTNIQASIGRVQHEVDSLHAQLQALRSSWQGMAATSFHELVDKWRATAALVDGQLGQLGQALALAAQQYAETEAATLRLFTS